MVPDYHLHTALCKHAQGSPSEFRNAARSLGIPMIEIGVGVFIGAVEGEDELPVELPPG